MQMTAPLPGAEHPGKIQKAVETTQVKNKHYRNGCRTSRRSIHALGQGQVPDIAKTDETPQAQFMLRRWEDPWSSHRSSALKGSLMSEL